MAERRDVAFETLGRIVVDLDALDKSLDAAEVKARSHGKVLQRIWDDSSQKTAAGATGLGDAGVVGGMGRADSAFGSAAKATAEALAKRRDEIKAALFGAGGAAAVPTALEKVSRAMEDTATRTGMTSLQFSHLTRVVRDIVGGPLSQLSPALDQATAAMARSARGARFYGLAFGGAMLASVAVTMALGKYMEAAKEATATTLDISQALKTLDVARVETGLKRVTDAIAAYNIEVDIAEGKVEGGFWQKVVAWSAIAAEAMTGSLDTQIKKFHEYAAAAAALGAKVTIPEAEVKEERAAGALMQKQADRARQNATSQAEVAASYDLARAALDKKHAADVKDFQLQEERARAPIEAQRVALVKNAIEEIAALEEQRLTELRQADTGAGIIAEERAEIDARIGAQIQAARERLNTANVAAQVLTNQKLATLDKDRTASTKEMAESKAAINEKERRDQAQLVADAEGFVQKEIQRGQRRLESHMAAAMAIEKAEQDIAKVRREQAGTVESAAEQEAGFTKAREHSTSTLVAGLEAANALYASQRREIEGLVAAGVNAIGNQEKLADLEREHADDIITRKNKIAQVTAENAAREAQERQRRRQEETALEDRQLAHRVAMGRVSMQDQMETVAAGRTDPRRTAAQQEQAEEQLLGLKREYAERYFRLYDQLGASTWEGQLESAKSFLSQTVEGSRAWFDQVTKISDIYKAIHDQAKSIFQQELGIAASEAQREGRTRMRISDVDKYVAKVRKRDEKILAGKSGTIADVTGAVSRRDLFQTVDREGLSPREAWARMQRSPQQDLAETLTRVATQQVHTADIQVASTNQFAAAVDKFGAAVDRIGAGQGGRGNDVNPLAPQEAPGSRSVLPSKGPRAFSNMMLSADTSSLLGRSLYLEGKRGPSATESAQ